MLKRGAAGINDAKWPFPMLPAVNEVPLVLGYVEACWGSDTAVVNVAGGQEGGRLHTEGCGKP